MKNFFRLLLGIALFAAGLGVSGYRGDSPVAHMGAVHNRYERAQHQTVLVISPDHSQGTGVVIQRDTRIFVWTAAHVVFGFDKADVQIVIRNGTHKVGTTTFAARVIALDAAVDAALLFVDAPADYFIPATFDTFLPPPVGTPVYHVGNFLGADFDNSVSTGVLSQVGVNPGADWPWAVTDQTSAIIVSGSSGGPIFNSVNNKVLGLVVGRIVGEPIYVYIPIRVIEVWADGAGLGWAIRGDKAPAVLPRYVAPVPPKINVLLISPVPPTPPQKKK